MSIESDDSTNVSIDEVKQSYQKGTLNRRECLVQLLQRGLTAAAAYTVIGEFTQEASAQQNKPNVDQRTLEQYSSQLQKLVIHPDVIGELRKIQSAPGSQRKALATNLVNRLQDGQYRRSLGFDSPNLRLSTRVFEDPNNPQTLAASRYREQEAKDKTRKEALQAAIEAAAQSATICGSIGYIVCVSVGGVVEEA